MDWKDIKPLKEFEARKLVKDYFSKHGFSCEEVDPSKLQEGQHSPDLIVRSNGNVSFYCEIKTPEHRLNPVTQMYHWDTIFYKLRRFLHTASKQFKDYDPKHE